MLDEGRHPAILFFNLVGMKHFNRQYGFAEGDKLLREFSRILIRIFGGERCCRIGADHFAVQTEETGLQVRAEEAVFVIEGAQGEAFHRVDIVFRCDYLGAADTEEHTDYNQIGCEWLDIETLNKAPLYPSRLRRPIMDLYAGKDTAVYLGNENAGDPGITD